MEIGGGRKGKVVFEQDKEDAEEVEESRNNLYWVDGQDYFCLWYGDMRAKPTDLVQVLPIRCYDMSNLVVFGAVHRSQPSVMVAPLTSNILFAAVTDSAIAKSNSSGGAVAPCSVKRSSLMALDEEVLRQRCKDPLTRDFASAMLAFAEWDDSARHSYVWPSFINKLFQCKFSMEAWFRRASLHPLSARIGTGRYGRAKLFLYLLVVEHLGVAGGYIATDNFVGGGRLDNASSDVLDLLFELNNFNGMDSESTEFTRSSSRLGSQYQVNLAHLDEVSDVAPSSPSSFDPSECLVFRPSLIGEEECSLFLSKIKSLRIKYIEVGHIVEAPAVGYRKRPGSSGWESSTMMHQVSELGLNDGDETVLSSSKRQYSLCTVVHIRKVQAGGVTDFRETNIQAAGVGGCNSIADVAIEPSCDPSEDEAVVYDGSENWTVHLSLCHSFSMSDDEALELLHSCSYDTLLALNQAEQTLLKQRQQQCSIRTSWSIKQIDLFLHIARRHPRNIRKLWKRFCDPAGEVAKTAQTQETSLYSPGHFGGVAEMSKTIKDVLNFYYLFFQGIADDCEEFEGENNSIRLLSVLNSGKGVRQTPATFAANSGKGLSPHTKKTRSLTSSVPSRWPKSLRMLPCNLYWLKANNSPCVCLGLEPVSGLLRVVPICSATYHHAVSVSAAMMEPLTEALISDASDERAAEFAGAMKDFAEWEIDNWPPTVPACRWYEYPKFIMQFLSHSPTFSAWRKQAERSFRGKGDSRRVVYFESLKETFGSANSQESENERYIRLGHLPWDDYTTDSSDDEESITSDESSKNVAEIMISKKMSQLDEKKTSEEKTATKKIKSSKGVATKKETFTSLVAVAPPPPPPPPPAPKPVIPYSRYSMFWLPKSNLPSLFFDAPGMQNMMEFTVLPVCCSTYHYAVKVSYNTIEPLTLNNLKLCTDERTLDFTLALMDFAEWDIKKSWMKDLENKDLQLSPSLTTDEEEEFYLWPDFILDLINSPREWASWRKRVERNAGGSRSTRRNLYLSALCEGFREELQKIASSPSLELEENDDPDSECVVAVSGVKRSRDS